MEEICSSIKGIYRDVLKSKDNNVIFDSGWVSNLIVDGCRTLLAAYMKNDKPGRIKCLKVGRGEKGWDDNGPPPPHTSLTALQDEDPFTITLNGPELVYLDENDAEVTGPTNRLQITATLGAGEPPPAAPLSSYPLREFGLFGIYVDDSDNEHEYMIDCVRHPVIHKDVSASLIRVVRLYF